MQLLPLLFGLNRAFPQTLTILCAFVLPDSFCSWEKKKVTPPPISPNSLPFFNHRALAPHTHSTEVKGCSCLNTALGRDMGAPFIFQHPFCGTERWAFGGGVSGLGWGIWLIFVLLCSRSRGGCNAL